MTMDSKKVYFRPYASDVMLISAGRIGEQRIGREEESTLFSG